MTLQELEQNLSNTLEQFSNEMRATYDDYSKEPATGGDIAELSRQTFYALNAFKTDIISYLRSIK